MRALVWINALGDVDKKAAAGDLEACGELIKERRQHDPGTDYPALLMKYLLKSKNLYYNCINNKVKRSPDASGGRFILWCLRSYCFNNVF